MKTLKARAIWLAVVLWIAVGLAAVVALALPLRQAHSQDVCGPWEKVVGGLEKQYNEQMIGAGVSSDNRYIVQLFAERTGKTWSLLRTDTKGWTCIIGTGDGWNENDPWGVKPDKTSHHINNPPHSWIQPKKNSRGISCCGPTDIAEIPNHEAAQAEVGSQITADFPGYGRQTVTIDKILPSEDSHSYVTRWGCLFKQFGM